jgi:hypothetical protein
MKLKEGDLIILSGSVVWRTSKFLSRYGEMNVEFACVVIGLGSFHLAHPRDKEIGLGGTDNATGLPVVASGQLRPIVTHQDHQARDKEDNFIVKICHADGIDWVVLTDGNIRVMCR